MKAFIQSVQNKGVCAYIHMYVCVYINTQLGVKGLIILIRDFSCSNLQSRKHLSFP